MLASPEPELEAVMEEGFSNSIIQLLSVSLSSSTRTEGKRDALSAAALLLILLQNDWRSQPLLSPDQYAKLSSAGDREQKSAASGGKRRNFDSSSS
ncbi:hypothetical protein OPV22_017917 [Ensete ventricosum]|uniref:Uncharacterized protein n=1 Tax=Ensete ventricosum TaxID=4639 RepID=A0AAV8QT59_ENSVE|nr:hypothetical protein OPV22_017917 [Ensete ventricosum]